MVRHARPISLTNPKWLRLSLQVLQNNVRNNKAQGKRRGEGGETACANQLESSILETERNISAHNDATRTCSICEAQMMHLWP